MHFRVKKHLVDSGIRFKIRKHSESNKTIESPLDFSTYLGFHIDRITKTLFLRSGQSTYICLVCSVLAKAKLKVIAEELSISRLQFATKEELATVLDYPPLGVSPLGASCAIAVDRNLLSHSSILVGGGTAGVEIEISPQDLVTITSATTGLFGLENTASV